MIRLTWTTIKDDELVTHVASYRGRTYAEITHNVVFGNSMWINNMFPQPNVNGKRPTNGLQFDGKLEDAKRTVGMHVRKYVQEMCEPIKATATLEKAKVRA